MQNLGHWTSSEREKFLYCFEKYATSWSNYQRHITTRTYVQIATYGRRYVRNLHKEKVSIINMLRRLLFTYFHRETTSCRIAHMRK